MRLGFAKPHWCMKTNEAKRSASNKKIAIMIGAIVFIWYVVSMFTVWYQ